MSEIPNEDASAAAPISEVGQFLKSLGLDDRPGHPGYFDYGDHAGDHGEVPTDQWVDVPKGKMLAMDTYQDDHGVLRSSVDDSCVVWHSVRKNEEGGRERCERKGIQPNEIRYDPDTGAPWCPDCYDFRPRREDAK